ncbi:hypothetical protein [Paractinoplanes hotanensis]|uniref:5-bromo-4-chloroindolyl phosphate hydrolysis protein n=1 Tax=Paractinoplanes hotanensis TaxID=2906497 RepID=A0ABT0YCV2_9ACTN|nr:hypothetical protein [Actinoplanes hotanensis]MCM4083625.1 hypothetical protein [Actinoplanes hotanensis]
MAGSRLFVARDSAATVVSRERLPLAGARLVDRPWSALVEVTVPDVRKPDERHESRGAGWIIFSPLIAGGIAASLGAAELGILVAAVTFFGLAYVEPSLRRRFEAKRSRSAPISARILTASAERAAFEEATRLADSVSTTWPHLGALIETTEAEAMLADALWEIAGVLTRRQKLARVLADLSRPDFAAQSPSDETALELRSHLHATEQALAVLEADLTRRLASLRRAEQAGRNFIREDEMRRAIREARETLGAPDLDLAALSQTALTPADAAADLADQTRSVLDAYRELTAGLHPDHPTPA